MDRASDYGSEGWGVESLRVRWSVGELLVRFVEADHRWKPATWSSHRSVMRFLFVDRLAGLGLAGLSPVQIEGAAGRRSVGGGGVGSLGSPALGAVVGGGAG